MRKVYHYANPYWIKHVLGDGKTPAKGLVPQAAGAKNLGEDQAAIFALFQPQPENWVRNSTFPDIWNRFSERAHSCILLEIDVEQSDQAFVVDFAHIAATEDFRNRRGITSSATVDLARKRYRETMIPLASYNPETSGFLLPEIVIFNTIPSDRLHVAREQPFLKEKLQAHDRGLLSIIRKVPALTHWYQENKENYDVGNRKKYRK